MEIGSLLTILPTEWAADAFDCSICGGDDHKIKARSQKIMYLHFSKKNKTEGQHWWTTYQYHTYRVSCFRRKLAMHVKFWHSNWRQNITLVSTKRFTSERAIKIRVFAWYWVAFYARTPILRATCHVKFVIMVRVIVITLDRTRQCGCSNLLVSSRIWYYICNSR